MSGPGLRADELDEVYTSLCYGLTERGAEATPAILARLVLLLMHEVGERDVIERAIRDALAPPPDQAGPPGPGSS
jgi:hypothetical protein